MFERNWSGFNQQSFVLDFFEIDWPNTLNVDGLNVNNSFETFIKTMNSLLDKHIPLKKISKYKLKFKEKPWITTAIKKSIEIKNKLFSKYINSKNELIKNYYHNEYKTYRNLLSTLMKRSKSNYYSDFFEKNINNIKNTWKGIKSLISNSKSFQSAPHSIISNSHQLTDPKTIADTFNNYFCSVADNIQSSIKFSLRSYDYYLNNMVDKSFFISPTDHLEIEDLILNLKIDKSEGPNGIPTKILHLLKNDISHLLADLFQLLFLHRDFLLNI